MNVQATTARGYHQLDDDTSSPHNHIGKVAYHLKKYAMIHNDTKLVKPPLQATRAYQKTHKTYFSKAITSL